MPVVQVEMWEGRTEEQKEKLMKGIMMAFEAIGVKKERVTIIIHETSKSNWVFKESKHQKQIPNLTSRPPIFWQFPQGTKMKHSDK